MRDVVPIEPQAARADGLQPRDQAQQRGFSAARGADEDDELAALDGEVHATDDVRLAKALAHVLQLQIGHGFLGLKSGYLTAPKVMPCTSCFWLNQPNPTMGAMASSDAAESRAQNSPSGLE